MGWHLGATIRQSHQGKEVRSKYPHICRDPRADPSLTSLDSPAAYVMGLTRLFLMAQLLDEHTKALCSQPVAPVYGALPTDIRTSVEMKLRRYSEFFASVVLTFVIRDLSQLLDKYAKKCEKWLAE
jgi:hypothetical protein